MDYERCAAEFGELNLPTIRIDGHDVPVIDHPDARILKHVEADPRRWQMDYYANTEEALCSSTVSWIKSQDFRGCGTVHCLAGWLIHICGAQGYRLMEGLGEYSETGAATMIYAAAKGIVAAKKLCFAAAPYAEREKIDAYNAEHLELLRQRAAADPLPEEAAV
jgi:hypothetical protein